MQRQLAVLRASSMYVLQMLLGTCACGRYGSTDVRYDCLPAATLPSRRLAIPLALGHPLLEVTVHVACDAHCHMQLHT